MTIISLYNILNLKKAILLGAKLISILCCIYFIKNAQDYNIKWNLLTWLFPQFTLFVSECMSDLGTYILLLPVAIMILSFLIADNMLLNIISGFFGITGSLIGIIKGIYTKTLGQVYDLKLFVVTHIATYEQKKEYFLIEFKRLSTEISQGIVAKLNYINKHLSDVDFIAYDKVLRTSTTMEEVQTYAKGIVMQLATQYNELTYKKPWNLLDHVSFKTVAIVIGVGIIIGFIAYNMIDHNDNGLILKTTELSKDTVEGTAQLNNIVSNNIEISKDIISNINRVTTSLALTNATVGVDTERINTIEKSLLAITEQLTSLQQFKSETIRSLVEAITKIETKIEDFIAITK